MSAAVTSPGRSGAPVPVIRANTELVNQRVGQVYAHVAGALGATAIAAAASAKMGFAVTVLSAMASSPLLTGCGFLAIAVGLMAAVRFSSKENPALRYGCYGLFTVAQGVFLSPLVLINGAAFAAATASTVVLTGGLGLAAMSIKENFEKYEKIALVALGAISLASVGALVLPAAAAAVSHQVSYVGGFALFSFLTVLDTHKARSEADREDFDPAPRSIDIYLNSLNQLIRLWEFFHKRSAAQTST